MTSTTTPTARPGHEPWCTRDHTPDPAVSGSSVCNQSRDCWREGGYVLLSQMPGFPSAISVSICSADRAHTGYIKADVGDFGWNAADMAGFLRAVGRPGLAAAADELAAAAGGGA